MPIRERDDQVTTGPWEFKPEGKDGEAVAFGQYITIWRKQSDGAFKAVLDIGITHEKPESVETDWYAPTSEKEVKVTKAPPTGTEFWFPKFLEATTSVEARLYRNGRLPVVGRKDVLSYSKQQSNDLPLRAPGSFQSGGSSDLHYCYGKARHKQSDTDTGRSGNLLPIFKFRDGRWQLVLEVFDG